MLGWFELKWISRICWETAIINPGVCISKQWPSVLGNWLNEQYNWMSAVGGTGIVGSGIVGRGGIWYNFTWKYAHVTQTPLGNHSKQDNPCLLWLLCHSRDPHKWRLGQLILRCLYHFPQPWQTCLINHQAPPGVWMESHSLSQCNTLVSHFQSIRLPAWHQTRSELLQSKVSTPSTLRTTWNLVGGEEMSVQEMTI